MKTPILEMKHIRKTFASTVALGDVDLNVYPGEIRGLIGENGSGKSTISSIAAGMQKADSGEMRYHGEAWTPGSMIDALSKGIGMIVQESGTIQGVSVAENLFLGETKQFPGPFGTIDRKAMNAKADEALQAIGVKNVSGATPMGALDFQTRKLVEIAKVVMKDPEILVVDETTTALSQEGRSILYTLMKKLRDEGKAVLFISHDLDEIMEVCDTLTVLRDGAIIRHFTKDEFDADAIRTSMIGRELQGDYYRSDYTPSHLEKVAVKAEHISLGEALQDVSITVYKGDIVEIAETEELFDYPLHPYTRSLISAIPIPDPKLEKHKVLFTYDPSVHDYSTDKPQLTDIGHNHFVYGNSKEIEEYKAQREAGVPLKSITILPEGEEEPSSVSTDTAIDEEFLKTPVHDTGSIWLAVLCFFLAPLGIIATLLFKKYRHFRNYKMCKKGTIAGFCVLGGIVLLFLLFLLLSVL